jgi:SAM-dependent methyltransferase
VLDLCCGVAGPGRLLRSELGCDYLGVDASADAVAVACERAGGLGCRFAVAEVPPVPDGPFDVVLLLETLLAFPEKRLLLEGIARAVRPGGRFAFTVEAGAALDAVERERMPRSDTVWPVPLPDLLAVLVRAGLRVSSAVDVTARHHGVAAALTASFEADRDALERRLGRGTVAELLASHRLWSEWLGTGRVRKVALVATKAPPG